MARIEKSIKVNVPPEKAFSYLKNLENMPEWMPSCKSHKITSKKRYGLGTTTHCVMKQAGRIIEWDSEVTEYSENKQMSWHCEKPSRNDGTFEFKPAGKGTEITFIMDYDLPYSIFGALIDKLKVRKDIERSIDEGLEKMKEILEK